ncbi:MAG TPA: hypothetical protein VGP31_15475 [Planosporangium sp.]|nr:hypothetical protein [Planosporangium sp.]
MVEPAASETALVEPTTPGTTGPGVTATLGWRPVSAIAAGLAVLLADVPALLLILRC